MCSASSGNDIVKPFQLEIDGKLAGEILPDESTWCVSDGKLEITMAKARAHEVWQVLSN